MEGKLQKALDGSLVEELIRPDQESSRNLSLARAVIEPGQRTWRHHHRTSEEIYYVLAGEGVVAVGALQHRVEPGSSVLIPAGAEHCATCLSEEPLVILCCCSPPYQDVDTVVTEEVLV